MLSFFETIVRRELRAELSSQLCFGIIKIAQKIDHEGPEGAVIVEVFNSGEAIGRLIGSAIKGAPPRPDPEPIAVLTATPEGVVVSGSHESWRVREVKEVIEVAILKALY